MPYIPPFRCFYCINFITPSADYPFSWHVIPSSFFYIFCPTFHWWYSRRSFCFRQCYNYFYILFIPIFMCIVTSFCWWVYTVIFFRWWFIQNSVQLPFVKLRFVIFGLGPSTILVSPHQAKWSQASTPIAGLIESAGANVTIFRLFFTDGKLWRHKHYFPTS